MSYYNGPPPPNQQFGGYPPQQGYGPPQGQYPPPGPQYGAPPQPPYGSHPQQQGYGPPQGQYGAPQPPYGSHPQQGHGVPQGQYGATQPPYGSNPQQQGYGAPPGQHGPPPGQYQPPQQYNAPQWNQGPASPPSVGYVPGQVAQFDMGVAADQLRKAMKGFGTDETALIATLAPMGPLEVAGVKQAFQSRHRRDLMKDIASETSNYFEASLLAVVRGPLDQDCFTVNEAIKGAGTKESALDDVLLSRTNADLNAIKARYQQMYRRSLEQDVKGDLSMKTERMYDMVLAARRTEESTPIDHQQIEAEVAIIYKSTEGRAGTDELEVCRIFSQSSDGQLRAISQTYLNRYRRPLTEVIKKEFSGHMEDALLFMLRSAEDRAHHDADLFEEAMKGMGTKDVMLIRRIVMVHWNRDRMQQARAAYKHFYKQDLAQRIGSETSGDYGKFLQALV